MKKGTNGKCVSFRLTDEEFQGLEAKALEHGFAVHEFARALVLIGAEKEAGALVRKATRAASVAPSSPQRREQTAELKKEIEEKADESWQGAPRLWKDL